MTHLVHVFPSFTVGGAQTVTAKIIAGLGTRVEHTIVSLDGSCAGQELIAPALRVRMFDGRMVRRRGLAGIHRFLSEARPDLLLTTNWGSMDWTLAKPRLRQIHQEHGFGAEEAGGQFGRRVWVRRAALRRAWRVVVPSRRLAGLARGSWWVPEHRLLHIQNGVPPAERPAAPDPDGVLRIGTVAPLRAEKRLDWLLRAFAGLDARRPCRLVVVGDGPERPRLEALAAELGIQPRVSFAGHQREPRRTMRNLDLYALSSATEQLPMSLLDAMALGLPVAGVAVGDVADAVATANRPYIAPADDFAAFSRALGRLATDAGLRAALGRANRDRQRACFSDRSMVDAYTTLVETGLGAPRLPVGVQAC